MIHCFRWIFFWNYTKIIIYCGRFPPMIWKKQVFGSRTWRSEPKSSQRWKKCQRNHINNSFFSLAECTVLSFNLSVIYLSRFPRFEPLILFCSRESSRLSTELDPNYRNVVKFISVINGLKCLQWFLTLQKICHHRKWMDQLDYK